MATVMRTPGVYVVEKDAFPNSIVEVATAVPAFIGYTEKAIDRGRDLKDTPHRITSLAEFRRYFGGAPPLVFDIVAKEPAQTGVAPAGPAHPIGNGADGKPAYLQQKSPRYHLYHSMVAFFKNGGGPCYVVSVGTHGGQEPGAKREKIEKKAFDRGIKVLLKEQEPTMIVMPDAVLLPDAECAEVQSIALQHCGKTMSRVTILDVHHGYRDIRDCIPAFRSANLSKDDLKYGAAYYPWLETTIVSGSDLGLANVDPASRKTLQGLIDAEIMSNTQLTDDKKKEQAAFVAALATAKAPAEVKEPDRDAARIAAEELDKGLAAISPLFQEVVKAMQGHVNLLPPSGAVAGIYTAVDNRRGVWKAPANVNVTAVVKPAVAISHDDQEDLNVTPQGKSVNAIRTFIGEGTLVWGARTLDGNSLDWRYVNVRRTMIMLEQSIKLATKAYVFEPNDANTWITIKSMIRNFLTGIWRRGGLAGASPDDAFSVHVGLGETMTAEDILEGILRVTVLVAPTRPAEFIELTFQQQMQKS